MNLHANVFQSNPAHTHLVLICVLVNCDSHRYIDEIKAVAGVVSVTRTVCGGCYDFKICTKVKVARFGAWEEAAFAPEGKVLAELGAIAGISSVETQTFTLEDMM